MKPLRSLLDRIHPWFVKGGKLERLYPLYEAMDTFLYVPGDVTKSGPHIRDSLDMKRMMSTVVVALIPCIFMALYNTGYQANLAMSANEGLDEALGWRGDILHALGIAPEPGFLSNLILGATYFLPVYLVTMTVGGLWEVLFAVVRKHEINEGFLVTGMLYPLTLPPTIPLWQVALGISFGVVIGKEIFGGTGRNFLNPALTARAFLYFAYPGQITGDVVWNAVAANSDAVSGATALGNLAVAPMAAVQEANGALASVYGYDWWTAFFGFIPGSMGETSAFACLLGAALLIATGIGSWRIMAGVLAGGIGMSTLLWLFSSSTNPMFHMAPWWHVVVGGYAFGLVFMATDPVSAAMTEQGKWAYGILIGVMTILIRVINPAYPEGIMLAILFGNVFAPTLDWLVVNANIRRRLARNVA